MAIRIEVDPRTKKARVQLILPDDIHDGPVSAVGTFNNWTPGRHKLIKRNNGTRSVTVQVEAGAEVCFRYLGSGGHWFDDPEAHAFGEGGGIIRV